MGILNGTNSLENLFIKDDGVATETSIAQSKTEASVYHIYKAAQETNLLKTEEHINYVLKGLKGLEKYFVGLDASKPWLCYWMLHSLDLLGHKIDKNLIKGGISTISKLQNPTGGFAGGIGQISHAAVTYAAVNALAILGTKEAYDLIDRENLYKWCLKLKKPDGSFTMHENGEVDIRGAYCILSVATLVNIITPELIEGTAEWIKSQNFDGGIGGEPGIESHGGYAFCGLAAMEIMNETNMIDIPLLLHWATSLQMQLEGGFQGRPNKLVDGCYSFWVGALFPLIEAILTRQIVEKDDKPSSHITVSPLFDREALQEYILIACQYNNGGLVDKPTRRPDYYHTSYCLSGLSTAQHHMVYDIIKAKSLQGKTTLDACARSLLWSDDILQRVVLGNPKNIVNATHPVHNITIPKVHNIINYFKDKKLFD
nr:303_t:CDS:10 [Entrophospora candida]